MQVVPPGFEHMTVDDVVESFRVVRLEGCDYFLQRMNDGRVDLRQVFVARRDEDGRFVGEVQRADTSKLMHIPPAYYMEAMWTESWIEKKESHSPVRRCRLTPG